MTARTTSTAETQSHNPTGNSAHWQFCHDILPDVSRTFALTIPVLPNEMANAVCCAYLICRIADTIEDQVDLTESQRAELFSLLHKLLDHPNDDALATQFVKKWPTRANCPYQPLMRGTAQVMAAYSDLTPAYRQAIGDCAREMMDGMQQMIHRPEQNGIVVVCENLDELHRYCHYVAGTVGIMLTRLFASYLAEQGLDPQQQFNCTQPLDRTEQGRQFGLGLQLTNIIKDAPEDLTRGISFFPLSWRDTSNGVGPLSVDHQLSILRHALTFIDEAQAYSLAIPATAPGLRLFCLWAAWMAVATLRQVAQAPRTATVKISRLEVVAITNYTRQHVTDDAALSQQYQQYREQFTTALAKLS